MRLSLLSPREEVGGCRHRAGGGDNAGQIWGIDQISHRKNLNFCGLDA